MFKDLTPDEAKFLTLQFMGQNLMGELKELDKNIVSGIARPTVDPHAILNSIGPSAAAPQQPAPQQAPPQQFVAQQPVFQAPVAPPAEQVVEQNKDQLELDFSSSTQLTSIFDKLDRLERNLQRVIEKQEEIIETLSKKKDASLE
jgi:hypothetical protein